MYQSVLLSIYLLILIPALTHLIRYRSIPSSRRISTALGVAGVLIAPTASAFICELLVSVFSFALFILIFVGGLGTLVKLIFYRRV